MKLCTTSPISRWILKPERCIHLGSMEVSPALRSSSASLRLTRRAISNGECITIRNKLKYRVTMLVKYILHLYRLSFRFLPSSSLHEMTEAIVCPRKRSDSDMHIQFNLFIVVGFCIRWKQKHYTAASGLMALFLFVPVSIVYGKLLIIDCSPHNHRCTSHPPSAKGIECNGSISKVKTK